MHKQIKTLVCESIISIRLSDKVESLSNVLVPNLNHLNFDITGKNLQLLVTVPCKSYAAWEPNTILK